MGFLETIILGAVQGLTEFLPVSSSGHLTLLQAVMGVKDIPLFYDVMLHVGTLIAVFIVLWPEIVAILTHPIKNKLRMLVLATIPAVIVAVVLETAAKEQFASIQAGQYLPLGFFLTTVVLVLCEVLARRYERKKRIELPQAMAMGVMQAAAAVFPGLSRSGSTIAGGLMAGAGREQAAKYAFLMSIPAILGGVVFSAKDLPETGLGDVSIPAIIVGVVVSAICGFLAIKFMLKLISKYKLYGFAIYTAAMGAFVLLLQNMNLVTFA